MKSIDKIFDYWNLIKPLTLNTEKNKKERTEFGKK